MAGPGDPARESAACKVKAIALVSAVFAVSTTILGFYVNSVIIKKVLENISEWQKEKGDGPPDDLAGNMMLQSIPQFIFQLAFSLGLPLLGFIGANQGHRVMLMVFFGCSFCCACMQCCSLAVMVGGVAFLTPFVDGFMAQIDKCDGFKTCEGQREMPPTDAKLIDCLAAGLWSDSYTRQYDQGEPPPPGCEESIAPALDCDYPAVLNAQMALDKYGYDPAVAAVEYRRLFSNPFQIHSKDWAWKVASAATAATKHRLMTLQSKAMQSGKSAVPLFRPQSLSTATVGAAPPKPTDPLTQCKVNLDYLELLNKINTMLQELWPQYQMLLKVSAAISAIFTLINCCAGFLGKQLHDIIDVVPAVPMYPPTMGQMHPQPQMGMQPQAAQAVQMNDVPTQRY